MLGNPAEADWGPAYHNDLSTAKSQLPCKGQVAGLRELLPACKKACWGGRCTPTEWAQALHSTACRMNQQAEFSLRQALAAAVHLLALFLLARHSAYVWLVFVACISSTALNGSLMLHLPTC